MKIWKDIKTLKDHGGGDPIMVGSHLGNKRRVRWTNGAWEVLNKKEKSLYFVPFHWAPDGERTRPPGYGD